MRRLQVLTFPSLQRALFDPSATSQDGGLSPEEHVGRRHVLQRFMIPPVVVIPYCPRTRSTPSDGLILRWTLAGSRRS